MTAAQPWYPSAMLDQAPVHLAKARESLEGAVSEYRGQRYNNCANRAYYACFQAAIAGLQREGIKARGGRWSHGFVPSQFEGRLIKQRKRYGSEMRGTLGRLYNLHEVADYKESTVSRTEADHALRRALFFVRTIQEGESK